MSQRRRQLDTQGAALEREALRYARAGVPVIPLHSINKQGRCTCGRKCDSPGKHPRIDHGLTEGTTDEAQIRKWFKRWGEKANIGGVLGDRFVAIDVDVAEGKGGEDSLRDLEDEYGEFPRTATAKTGKYGRRRGRHYFFTTEGEIGSTTGVLGHRGIDLRGHGGCRAAAVAPPFRGRV